MNIPKVILFNTLSEILSNDSKTEETKNSVKEIFTSDDTEAINSLILNNLLFFSSTSLIKYIVNEEEFIAQGIDLLLHSESYVISFFIDRLEENGVKSDFFLNDSVYNTLIDNPGLLKVIVRNNHDIFDIYPKDRSDKIMALFKSQENFSIIDLEALPLVEQQNMLNNPEVRLRIYQKFSHTSYMAISEETERLLWDSFKDELASISLSQKVEIFLRLNDSLKKEAFTVLKLDSEIDNISSFDFNKIAPYIDQSVLMEKVYNSATGNIDDKYLKNLTSENQIKVLNDLISRKVKILTNSIFSCLNLDVKEKAFDMFSSILTPDAKYNLYLETKNIKYLQILKEDILNKEEVAMADFLCEEDFISLCSEEEKELIASKIRGIGYIHIPSKNIQNYNSYFFKKYVEKMIVSLNTTNKRAYISFKDFTQYLNKDEQSQLIPFVRIEEWLDKILSDEDIFNYVLDILKDNPDFFKGQDFSKVGTPYSVNDKLLERIDEIINYFDEEQLIIFFSDEVLEDNEKLKDIFKQKAKMNPALINTFFKYNCFSEEEINSLLMVMDMEELSSLIDKLMFEGIDISPIVFKRVDEAIKLINDNINISNIAITIYNKLDIQGRKDFISKINNLYILNSLFKMPSIEESKLDKEIILSRQLELYNEDYYNICIAENYRIGEKLSLSDFSARDIDLFIASANMKMLIYVSTYYYSKKVVNKIIENTKSDITCLLNEDISPILNTFIFKLDDASRHEIELCVDKCLSTNEFYQNYVKDNVKDFNIKEKINFLNLFYNKKISSEKQELFLKLLSRNPYLLSTLDPVLLSDDMIGMGFHFIDKTSKYAVLESKLKLALINNPHLAPFLRQVSSYLQNNEISEITYDKKISIIIEYLSNKDNKLAEYDFNTITEDNISNIIEYILHNYVDRTIIKDFDSKINDRIEDLYDFNIENFNSERLKKCDELFNSSDDIDVMKNIYFNKYLSMTLYEALNFYKSYVVNYEKVRHLAINDIPDKFITLLSKIIDIDDPVTLRELYNTTDITYDIGDRYTIESIIEKAYYTSLVKDYVNKQNGIDVTKVYKDKNGNNVSLNMTELFDNFGILVHSTCAYGEMPLLDDDYFISWNNNPRTDNHGICCSYITNSSYGTATVENTGVMFGFTNINENSVATYSPYDLSTRNNGYTITSYHTPFFTTLDSVPDYTRHTHNEFDLERRNYSMSKEHSCVQPDCIIIFEDMPDNIKSNSIKAYEDFKKHGIELKLIYMDRLKIAKNEASKLSKMISEYSTSYDMNLLKDIINLYESNICGCDFLKDFNADEVFMTDKVRSILNDSVNYIIQVNDIDLRNRLINDFINILEAEQYKFDLLDDFNKKRAHTFKLYDEQLHQSVEHLRSLSGISIEKGLVA